MRVAAAAAPQPGFCTSTVDGDCRPPAVTLHLAVALAHCRSTYSIMVDYSQVAKLEPIRTYLYICYTYFCNSLGIIMTLKTFLISIYKVKCQVLRRAYYSP